MIRRTLLRTARVLALAIAVWSPGAHAQTPAATFASVGGIVETQRGGKGDWQAASVGGGVALGDSVRTGASSFAKLLFTDDTVLDVGPSTEVAIEHYAGTKGPRRTLFHLAQGKVEVLVSGYGGEGSRFEVETPTAVVRVQSTDFVVRYDATDGATEVLGIDGVAAVQGTTGIIGPGVAVGPNEVTRVPRDGFPSPVKTVDAIAVRDATHGLRVIGTGSRDTLDSDNPIVDGRMVAASDRPGVTAAGAPAGEESYLRPGVPGETLLYSLSPDIRANNQPLPEYRVVPPNRSPDPHH